MLKYGKQRVQLWTIHRLCRLTYHIGFDFRLQENLFFFTYPPFPFHIFHFFLKFYTFYPASGIGSISMFVHIFRLYVSVDIFPWGICCI